MTSDVTLPWKTIDSFVSADRRFVATLRDVVTRIGTAGARKGDLEDWLVLRVPEIERIHQEILVADSELRSPFSGQNQDWLIERMHQLTGFRQTLGASYCADWNARIHDRINALAPELAVALADAASAVSAAAAELNRVFTESRQARKADPYHGRKMYAENHDWFWERRDASGDYHVWNGAMVPVDTPNRAAAIFFSGEADGYSLPYSVPARLKDPTDTRIVSATYGSLLGIPAERRRQFADALNQIRQERVVLGAELYQGRLHLLCRDEGIFGAWWLTDKQYSELQKLCVAHGWPKDLWIESVPWWQRRPR